MTADVGCTRAKTVRCETEFYLGYREFGSISDCYALSCPDSPPNVLAVISCIVDHV